MMGLSRAWLSGTVTTTGATSFLSPGVPRPAALLLAWARALAAALRVPPTPDSLVFAEPMSTKPSTLSTKADGGGGMGLPSKPFWLVSGLASDGLPGQETGLLGAEPISTELEKPRSLKRLDALADPSVRSSTPNLFLPRVGRKPLRFKRQ